MNAQWLAGIYDAAGRINRGVIIFNVKNELNEKLYDFLYIQLLHPSKTVFTVRITRRDDIDRFYTLIKPFLYDNAKILALEKYIYSRRPGQRISDDDKVDIVERIKNGETMASIAEDYNVSRQAIFYVKKGENENEY